MQHDLANFRDAAPAAPSLRYGPRPLGWRPTASWDPRSIRAALSTCWALFVSDPGAIPALLRANPPPTTPYP